MDGDEPTQATQNVLDPRRVGQQNSGFSDEDVSDIICVLYPHSDSARHEVKRLARDDSPHIIGSQEADVVEPDYELEDDASRFDLHPPDHGNYAIVLRLSSQIKNPEAGFAFGRNHARCDVVFVNDPHRRISNIHFRIYVNEYGNVMIEDQSTNGTWVDNNLLTSQGRGRGTQARTKWVLSSGTVIKVYLHDQIKDLTFRVRIPRRDSEYDRAYTTKVEEFFARNNLQGRGLDETIGPGPGGHVDIFGRGAATAHPGQVELDAKTVSRSPSKHAQQQGVWNGSGKYHKIAPIGKGAFALVYKVTSMYDGRPYAAKEIEKRRFIKNGVLDQKVENEMKIMQRVNHPNIVRYIENFEWDNRFLIIVMEYVSGGDLGKLISENAPVSEAMTQVMSKQLLSALGYLHANNITHRDVKPDNILINSLSPLDVKLTDFGLSKIVDSTETFLQTFCGTLLYCAPEVYTEYTEYDDHGFRSRGKKSRRTPGQRYNHAVDIWSLGGVLFYTLTGSPPYPVKSGISYSELLHQIMTTRLNIAPLQQYGVSEQGIDFLCSMLQRRPEHRATVLELDAHTWLGGPGSTVQASQSYDEITDEEDIDLEPSQKGMGYDEDRVSDSMGEESEKENNTFGKGTHPPRLFGEVGSSALRSSGAIPEDFLNLPVSDASMGVTEILDGQTDQGYDSDDSSSFRENRNYRQTTVSIAQNQSADQLQSLVEDVASQSLGGDESFIRHPASSHYTARSIDFFTTSKRKPPSTETSDEFDDNTPPGKPNIKRLKSEGNVSEMTDLALEEYKLLARMPQIRRLGSGRQIDKPVSKITFWEQDKKTWHLKYPEMTQLQQDAFSQAARDGGEEFGPGKTRLWDLAMKYFPPSTGLVQETSGPGRLPFMADLRRDDRKVADDMTEFPPTAAPIDMDPIPDTLPPESQIVVPIQEDAVSTRAVGMVESDESSCVPKISFAIKDSLVAFGRGPDNTQIFEPRTESRVPKYAFKIMLWKEGYDPSKDPTRFPHPWLQDTTDEEAQSYSFWMSTKATLGIHINGYVLPSSDAKNPNSPSQNWTRVYHGDELIIWGASGPGNQTKLVLRCFWGGSSRSRGEHKALELAPAAVAQKLDIACQRTELRIRHAVMKQRKVDEANREQIERLRLVERERERSRAFEARRQEAVTFLQARIASRRGSPASAPPTTNASRLQTARQSPDMEGGLATR